MPDPRYGAIEVSLDTPRGGKLLFHARATTDENVRIVFDGAETGQDFEPSSVRKFCTRILEWMDERKL